MRYPQQIVWLHQGSYLPAFTLGTPALRPLHQASAPGIGSGVTDRTEDRQAIGRSERPPIERECWFQRKGFPVGEPVRVVLETCRLGSAPSMAVKNPHP